MSIKFIPVSELDFKKPSISKKPLKTAKSASIVAPWYATSATGIISEEAADVMTVMAELNIPQILCDRMFVHQKKGVEWLYYLHKSRPGGILGDDMGNDVVISVVVVRCYCSC